MIEFLQHVLGGQNQFASGGLLLMAIGAVGAYLRSIPEKLWHPTQSYDATRHKKGCGIGAGLASTTKFAGGEVNGSFEGRRFESCHVPNQEHVAQLAERSRCREFPGD